jgi:hypothetical protein
MNLVKISSLLLLGVLLGCSKPTVLYKTTMKEVDVPVAVKINKPDRPIYASNDSMLTYLIKVIEYTETLEILIDEHNNLIKEDTHD